MIICKLKENLLMPRSFSVILFLSVIYLSAQETIKHTTYSTKGRFLKRGEDCTLNSNCEKGLKCISQQTPDYGIGSCKKLGRVCTRHEDCCSQKCSNKICAPFSRCGQCASKGKKPDVRSPCCPGLYEGLSKICIPDIPPHSV